jgi:hypothetical protein
MESSHTGELDIPELNAATSKANIFQEWPIIPFHRLVIYAMKAT